MAEPIDARDAWVRRAAVQDLLSAYVLSLDVNDIDAAVALFTDDGEFATYGRVWSGPAKVRQMFTDAPRGLHLAGRSLVTLTATGATARQQLAFLPADGSTTRLAVYDDDIVQTDGRWLFRRRSCRFINSQGVLGERP